MSIQCTISNTQKALPIIIPLCRFSLESNVTIPFKDKSAEIKDVIKMMIASINKLASIEIKFILTTNKSTTPTIKRVPYQPPGEPKTFVIIYPDQYIHAYTACILFPTDGASEEELKKTPDSVIKKLTLFANSLSKAQSPGLFYTSEIVVIASQHTNV